MTIKEAQESFSRKSLSRKELVRDCFEKIKEKDSKIHAFLSLREKEALKEAEEQDKEGDKRPLSGIPVSIKDNILVRGMNCTAGSRILADYLASYDATVISKLKKNGAIIIGKTNLDEFAMGASTENSGFGPTFNPHDLARVPGGSSGGSAASVAAGMAMVSLGSDTGGSIRQPASFCGIVGLKPTYGAVSRYGLIAMASSLDQIGPLASSVEDSRFLFDVIKGKDYKDSTSLDFEEKKPSKEIRIGIPREYFIEGMDKRIEEMIKKTISSLNLPVKEISLRYTEYAVPCYYIIVPSEVSANLARYDGIRYGLSKGNDLLDTYLSSRKEGLGKEVKRRIMIGTYCLSSGYYDAYYLRAQKVRTLIRQDFEKAFKEVDVIITPTSPTLAFKAGEKMADPLAMYLADIFTCPVNLAGLPAVSLPCGKIDNLPVGIQVIGKAFSEHLILDVSQKIEKNVSS